MSSTPQNQQTVHKENSMTDTNKTPIFVTIELEDLHGLYTAKNEVEYQNKVIDNLYGDIGDLREEANRLREENETLHDEYTRLREKNFRSTLEIPTKSYLVQQVKDLQEQIRTLQMEKMLGELGKGNLGVIVTNWGEDKIACIKLVRQINQTMGLKDAKDTVEQGLLIVENISQEGCKKIGKMFDEIPGAMVTFMDTSEMGK